jgi:FlaA1/EpsC-like NDP-sugar epimerase
VKRQNNDQAPAGRSTKGCFLSDRQLYKRLLQVLWDCFSWGVAALFVIGARYDFALTGILWSSVAKYVGAVCVAQVVLGIVMKLYRGRYRTASFDESVGLAITVTVVAGVVGIYFVGAASAIQFPRALTVLSPPIALMTMAGGRWAFRAFQSARLGYGNAERVIIYGAGNAGDQLIRLLSSVSSAPYRPVGLIDDARAKRNLRLHGVRVLGDRSQLVAAANDRAATTVIMAITNVTAELIQEVAALVEGAGLHFLVLPPLAEMVGGQVRLSDIREVDIEDILGRHQVATDLAAIAGYLTGHCVLVTGAGGSIGSELARQIHKFGPKDLVLLDRDESALHAVQLSIYGQGLLDTPDMVLCDIRDSEALEAVFLAHKPDVVFHAAALKHLPMLEQYPDEGWKTNVIGTLNVLRAAQRHGCHRFVNISTDKAADPSSVLGQTKRLAERLTSWFGSRYEGAWISVRFGNVLGSRGSMLTTFTTQIQTGGPVTVTHPEVTRFFMTIPEACELTIQAGAIGEPEEVLVLDMGTPVLILDVAKRLIAQANANIDIVFTGLRPGEKMHEVLLSEHESGVHKRHELISHVHVPPLDPAELAPDASAERYVSDESGFPRASVIR